MSDFILDTEYYGGYAYIKTNYSADVHIYKIVNAILSNSYCDVPIMCTSEPNTHEDIVPVLNVIHCGIDETKVVRVAVSDCEKIELSNDKVVCCKDCKHSREMDKYEKKMHLDTCVGCTRLSTSYHSVIMNGTDYCSYAERKTKGE